MMSATRTVFFALVVVLLAADSLQAQEQLASARALYAAAQYDQALEVLNRLSDGESSDPERQQIELYRTLCLFAVGRRADADRAIESIISREPLYQPGSDLPPRARTAFSDAKKRLLPAIVQQQYAEAKSAFERSEFQSAAAAFRRVLDALDDPDMGAAGRLIQTPRAAPCPRPADVAGQSLRPGSSGAAARPEVGGCGLQRSLGNIVAYRKRWLGGGKLKRQAKVFGRRGRPSSRDAC